MRFPKIHSVVVKRKPSAKAGDFLVSGDGGEADRSTYNTTRFSPKIFTALSALVVGVGVYSLLFSQAASNTVYYVSPFGSDSNPGTSTQPLKTIEAAAKKSDISCGKVIVKPGVYTDSNGDGTVVKIPSSASGSGTCKTTFIAEERITPGVGKSEIKGTNPTTYADRYGFDLNSASNIRIEGFEIYGFNPRAVDSSIDSAGIVLYNGGSGSVITANNIHNIGDICMTTSNSLGQNGIFLQTDNVIIEKNYIHDIGRKSGTGCISDGQHDHGVYMNGQGTNGHKDHVLRNNVFVNFVQGWAVQAYPGKLTNIKILNNTFSGGNPAKQYTLITTYQTQVLDSTISNNIFYNGVATDPKLIEDGGATLTGTLVSNNVASGSATGTRYLFWNSDTGSTTAPTGVKQSTNKLGQAYSSFFIDPNNAPSGYKLQALSPAKEAGLTAGEVEDDFEGSKRCLNYQYDAGAFDLDSSQGCFDETRPYDTASSWNSEVGNPGKDANGKYINQDPQSDLFMQAIKNNGTQLTSKFTEFTPTIVRVNNSTPKVTVMLLEGNYSWGNGYVYENGDNIVDKLSTVGAGGASSYGSPIAVSNVPIPDSFSPTQIPGSDDAQVVFWNTDTGEEWAFWQFRPTSKYDFDPLNDNDLNAIDDNTQSSNYTTTSAKWAGTNMTKYHTKTDANGKRYYARLCGQSNETASCSPPSTMGTGGRGAGTPYFAGLVRRWEVASGTINHALSFAYNYPCNQFRYPAAKSDGTNSCAATQIAGLDALHPPEGTRLQLDPDLTDSQLAAPPYNLTTPAQLTVAHAMQKYGLYIIDNSGRPKLNLEYSLNPNWSDESPLGEYSFSGIPWGSFHVVNAPCDPTSTGCSTTDTTPPDTTISATTPSNLITQSPIPTTTTTTASFTFSGSDNTTAVSSLTYECSLDSSTAYSACTSPKAYGTPTALTTGTHTFRVRAKDTAGNVDQTPATITWTITSSTSTCPTKAGDVNGDGSVNITDIGLVLSSYGQTTTTNCADLDKSGTVNIQDLSIILSKYGT